MKGRNLKLPLLSAAELLAKATRAASALVVAEGKESPAMPTRRIALGWITGAEDFTQLRSAAAKFPDTAGLATADQAVEHKNGSCCLKNDPRCRISWTVRTIPRELVKCFSAYEDATALQIPEAVLVEAEKAQNQRQAAGQINHVHQSGVEVPARVPERIAPVAKPAPPITETVPALSVFRALSELTIKGKQAFLGNCAAPDSRFITDGRILLLKSACEVRFAQAKTVEVGTYGPAAPVAEVRLKAVFDAAVKNATVEAEIKGYVLAKDLLGAGDDETPLACVATRKGDVVVVVDAHKLAFIQQKTGADSVRVTKTNPERQTVLCCKAGQPVAVAMPCGGPDTVAAFKKMIGQKGVSSCAKSPA